MTQPSVNPPRDIDADDIDNRFQFHPATEVTGPQHENWREAVRELAQTARRALPPGREKSLAITALEEAMFWGNAAIARNQ